MPITAIPVYTSRDHNEGWSTLMPSGGGGGGGGGGLDYRGGRGGLDHGRGRGREDQEYSAALA